MMSADDRRLTVYHDSAPVPLAEDHLLGGAAAERDLDLRFDLRLAVVEAVAVGVRERHVERQPAGNDRDLAHPIGAVGEHADDRLASFADIQQLTELARQMVGRWG